ncbi:hypothetical protein CHRYSEOSP005_11820 [Chryseobacterium sp. Alg-005]|uniref:hypothetical protein n=1 Tax=Chryseobacterium sp. Alg-005 TaxID=3159516 RepID=UPI0035558BAB
MNYIKEINSFYDWLETNSVSDSVITLWHGLMHINNKTGWKVEFTVAISTLQVKTGLSSASIKRARNVLYQLGRIKWKQRTGNQSSVYEIIPFADHSEPQSEPQTVPQSVPQTVPQSVPINKLNINKTNSSFKKEAKGKNIKKENPGETFPEIPDEVNTGSDQKEKSSAKKENEKYFTKESFKKKLLDLGVLEKHADDWIQARKNKRASFTESVIEGVMRECEKNNYPFPEAIRNCAEHSWQGFKYAWLTNEDYGTKQFNNSTNNKTGNSTGSFNSSGKVSARTLLARKLSQKAAGNSEGGNITIDAEIIE